MADIINGIKSNVHTYVDVEKFDAGRDCGEQCADTAATGRRCRVYANTCVHVNMYTSAALVRILPSKRRVYLRIYQGAENPTK